MRITVRLVLSILVVVSAFVLAFTLVQVRQEKQRQRVDLERRALLLAESLGESIEPLVQQGHSARLHRIVEKFGNRERIAGVAVYDAKGLPLAVTQTFSAQFTTPPEIVMEAITADQTMNDLITVGNKQMFVFVLPLRVEGSEEQVAGALVLFHDATYIQDRLQQIWQHNFLRLLVQALLISLVSLVVVRWTLIRPMQQMTEWMKRLRMGDAAGPSPPSHETLLHPLATEVTHLANSLSAARATAEHEARLRRAGDSLWTAQRLKEHLRTQFQGRSLFVVSNREPYSHVKRGRRIECVVPASGLVTALEPVLAACEGTWIAHGSGDADSLVVDHNDRLRVPHERPQYTLKRVWLTKEEEEGYYYGFANEGLWPLCHIAHTRPIFRAEDWRYYQLANEKFAQATLAELEGVDEPCVLIQDYHLALLPGLIKKQRPDARVGLFWHIPWPNPESFGICPWQCELLHGMLGADLIGFHIQFHCNNFLETVDRVLESRIEWEHFAVHRGDHRTCVKPFPISIAYSDAPHASAGTTGEEKCKEELLT
ncbi:MAG TPA: trehalose-6-phosphate synthase, partial [Verrucomicrobiae bacterium]|nr:trehalose-6-phosphate synthase [Verrucomicrobiae bacterium]